MRPSPAERGIVVFLISSPRPERRCFRLRKGRGAQGDPFFPAIGVTQHQDSPFSRTKLEG